MKNALKIVFVIIGTLIGAGFASGQEIYIFFFLYGKSGILGIIMSSLIIGFITYKTLIIVKSNKIKTYKDFLKKIINKKRKGDKNVIEKCANIIINVFILIAFFIMISGFGAYFKQELGINSYWGSIILASLSFFVFINNIKGFVKVNEILIPILIILLTLIGILNCNNIDFNNLDKIEVDGSFKWIISAIFYSSYNSILLVPILISLKDYIKDKKQITIISIISTGIIIILSLILFTVLLSDLVNLKNIEMPMVYIVSKKLTILKNIYGFIILTSIFTTSISLGTSFLQNVKRKNYIKTTIAICVFGVLVSRVGFSNLVSNLYPIFGSLGLIQIFKIIVSKSIEKNSKN